MQNGKAARDFAVSIQWNDPLCLGGECQLPLGHPSPGRFENAAFPFSQAVNAVSGDFVENWIDLPADEFRGPQIGLVREFVLLPEGTFGASGSRKTALPTARKTEFGPVKGEVALDDPFYVGNAGEQTAQMGP